jgi:hypothetical protein
VASTLVGHFAAPNGSAHAARRHFMTTVRRFALSCTLAALLAGAATSAASAATFYVNGRSGELTATCGKFQSPVGHPGEGPCQTITKAVQRAESSPAPNTIEVNPEEPYVETVELKSSKDAGLTINGEEPGVEIVGSSGPGVVVKLTGGVTLSNLKVRTTGTGVLLKSAVADLLAALTLNNVVVENEASGGKNGVEVGESGSLTMNGGEVVMENGTTGYGVRGLEGPIVLNGVRVLIGLAAPAEAGGVSSERSSLVMTNSRVAVEGAPSSPIAFGVAAGKDSSVSLQNDVVRQNAPAMGVLFENSPASVNGLKVEMLNASSNAAAVNTESETGGTATLSHLEVEGTWIGEGVFAADAEATLSDSRISQNTLSELPALKFAANGAARGLLVQRSVLQGAERDKPGALTVAKGNATIDSSQILGGKDGVYFENEEAGLRSLTLSASTVDAGALGIAGDAGGTNGVEVVATKGPGSEINASIQGSIVLETQTAVAAAGDRANIACTYSAIPTQAQAAGGGAGAIACSAGASGNSEVNPLASLFSEPLGAYSLNPASSAVGGVPAGALGLPFGLSPSTTDLAGHARTGDGVDACFIAQDKGALELQGHLKSCPSPSPIPPISGPVAAPIITNAAQSHRTWREGNKSAQISRKHKQKPPVGTTFSFTLNEAAIVSFGFSQSVNGRRAGRNCVAKTRKNAKHKSCKRTVTAGTFSFSAHPGVNTVSFAGRIPGSKKLKPGRYTLTITASNSQGARSAPKTLTFTIVR